MRVRDTQYERTKNEEAGAKQNRTRVQRLTNVATDTVHTTLS